MAGNDTPSSMVCGRAAKTFVVGKKTRILRYARMRLFVQISYSLTSLNWKQRSLEWAGTLRFTEGIHPSKLFSIVRNLSLPKTLWKSGIERNMNNFILDENAEWVMCSRRGICFLSYIERNPFHKGFFLERIILTRYDLPLTFHYNHLYSSWEEAFPDYYGGS